MALETVIMKTQNPFHYPMLNIFSELRVWQMSINIPKPVLFVSGIEMFLGMT
jgi:hypothetical protein